MLQNHAKDMILHQTLRTSLKDDSELQNSHYTTVDDNYPVVNNNIKPRKSLEPPYMYIIDKTPPDTANKYDMIKVCCYYYCRS